VNPAVSWLDKSDGSDTLGAYNSISLMLLFYFVGIFVKSFSSLRSRRRRFLPNPFQE